MITAVRLRADFERLRRAPSVRSGSIVVAFAPNVTCSDAVVTQSDIGLAMTASRAVGNAVRRNTLRRRCRAVARELQREHLLSSGLWHVIFRPASAACTSADIERAFRLAVAELSNGPELAANVEVNS